MKEEIISVDFIKTEKEYSSEAYAEPLIEHMIDLGEVSAGHGDH